MLVDDQRQRYCNAHGLPGAGLTCTQNPSKLHMFVESDDPSTLSYHVRSQERRQWRLMFGMLLTIRSYDIVRLRC